MDQAAHYKIISFIWGIADDVLRDLFNRGKYPDVILPMCVLCHRGAILEPTKKAVLETKQISDEIQPPALEAADEVDANDSAALADAEATTE